MKRTRDWLGAIGAAASVALSLGTAAAHHGSDDASDVRSLVMWIGAAVAAGALVLLGWVSSRRRRRDESSDGDPDG